MDTDLVLTLGIVLLVLSVPSLLSAWAESRAPRLGAIMLDPIRVTPEAPIHRRSQGSHRTLLQEGRLLDLLRWLVNELPRRARI